MHALIIAFVIVGAGVLLLALGVWALWRRATAEQRRLIKRIMRLRLGSKLRLAGRLAADRRIPLLVRAIPPLLVLYLAMPIDVIPDFIPVLGQLDDAVVVLAGVTLLLRFAPRGILEEQVAALEGAGIKDKGLGASESPMGGLRLAHKRDESSGRIRRG